MERKAVAGSAAGGGIYVASGSLVLNNDVYRDESSQRWRQKAQVAQVAQVA